MSIYRNMASRRLRKHKHRRSPSRRMRMRGGMAPLNDSSMTMGMKDNLSQGQQFLNIHRAQHGGAAAYPVAVTDSVLSGSMIAAARTGPLDTAMSQIRGMQDGGARRRGKKSKSRKTRKHKGSHKRGHSRRHRMRGGAAFAGSPLSGNAMLLPSGLERQAALNNDWDAARNPNYWAPKP